MSDSGAKLYRSPQLEKLWTAGYSLIGDVTFESAAYVARYALKKVVSDRDDLDRLVMKDTGEILKPEYITMSRGGRGVDGLGGIGATWYKKYSSDVYPHGNRVVRGRDMRPPRYYDDLYAVDDPLGYEEMKFLRENSVDKKDNTDVRLVVKEEVAAARLKLFPRD